MADLENKNPEIINSTGSNPSTITNDTNSQSNFIQNNYETNPVNPINEEQNNQNFTNPLSENQNLSTIEPQVTNENYTNINEIFTGWGKLECLDLSLSSKDEILKMDFQWIKGIMKNLKKIKVKKEFKNTFEINDFIMEYV